MNKPKLWKNEDLTGIWQVTIKLDGVRALLGNGKVLSRSGKPLYNLDRFCLDGVVRDVEVYCGSWNQTASKVRTQSSVEVFANELYDIDPIDPRLILCELENPTVSDIEAKLKYVVDKGYEGIVLRQGDIWYKVKPSETYDVKVIGIIEGKGKHKGKMGALETEMGNVGTGFTDAERTQFWNWHLNIICERYPQSLETATVIEVECDSLTKDGKFRNPRFKRVRFDK